MDIQLGYALLRDRRVPIRPKLIALAIGAAVVGFTELLQIPLESLFAVILPIVGIAGDVVLDGVESRLRPRAHRHVAPALSRARRCRSTNPRRTRKACLTCHDGEKTPTPWLPKKNCSPFLIGRYRMQLSTLPLRFDVSLQSWKLKRNSFMPRGGFDQGRTIHMIRKGQACWSAVGAKVGLLHRFIVGLFAATN
jgi:hypothetical protein